MRIRAVAAFALGAFVLLAAAQAAAQVVPGADPRTTQAKWCLSRSLLDPSLALTLADRLQADPSLPLEAQAIALACRARAEQLLLRGQASRQSIERLLALVAAPGTPPELRRRAWIQAIDINMPTIRTRQTLDLLDALMEQSRQRDETSVAVFLLHSMARLHVSQMDNPAAALPLFDEAVVLSRRTNTEANLREMQLQFNRGYTLLRLGRHDEAEAAFAITERMAQATSQMPLLRPRLDSARGEIHRAGGDLAQARALLEEADAGQQRNGDLRGRTTTLLRLAQLALDEGDPHAARGHAAQALTMAESGLFRSETRDALAMMEAVRAASGNPEAARRYRDRRLALDASLDREAALATLARMRARIDRDLGPGASRAPDLGQARLSRNLAVGGLALALIACTGLFWRARRTKRRLQASPREVG